MIREKLIPSAWLLLACLMIGAALGAACRAGADPTDPAEAFTAQHAADVCLALDTAPTLTGVTMVMRGIANGSDLTDFEVGEVIGLAAKYVCPHHIPLLRRYVSAYGSRGAVA